MIDINTNAVPWHEYPASLFHAAGLTLREAGFVKLNGILTVMMVIMHYTVVGFVTSPMADGDALVNPAQSPPRPPPSPPLAPPSPPPPNAPRAFAVSVGVSVPATELGTQTIAQLSSAVGDWIDLQPMQGLQAENRYRSSIRNTVYNYGSALGDALGARSPHIRSRVDYYPIAFV